MSKEQVLESVIEDHLVKRCAELDLLCLKVTAIGRRGMPDRMVLGHDHNGDQVVLFIELKRPGQKPRPSQLHRIRELRAHGGHTVVADTTIAVDHILDDYVINPKQPLYQRDPQSAPLSGRPPAVLIPRL